MAIPPLDIPLLSGPGTISIAMNFVGEGKSFLFALIIIAIFGVVCFITYLMFIMIKKIADRINPSLITVVTKIMGLILAVLAVQMLINGVFKVIQEFPGM